MGKIYEILINYFILSIYLVNNLNLRHETMFFVNFKIFNFFKFKVFFFF